MGVQEVAVRSQARRTRINKAIVSVLATSGLVALALIAPNAIGALGKVGLLPQRRQQVGRALTRLVRGGYVTFEHKDGRKFARLTEKGASFARSMQLGEIAPIAPKRWDKKWRVVIFDIPEKRRRVRARVREMLTLFKFHRLQDSVWVYPHDCEDLVALLKVDLKIGNSMLYMIVDSIENDLSLKKVFSLQ